MRNIVSMSGGKDSTATALLAIALGAENLEYVFADTGNEHPLTYEYLDYLEFKLDIKIRRISADFTMQIERKIRKLKEGLLKGWGEEATNRALSVLKPTGNPFLDMCQWKGRFPSTKARFCTDELKRDPIITQVFLPLLDAGEICWSWQGVRRDESLGRRNTPEFEAVGGGLFNYRPLVKWTAKDVFDAHKYMGVDPNPLYKMGMGRVGCMPCVNCRKSELQNIALRFPEEIARIKEWEQIISNASRIQKATFFHAASDPTVNSDDDINYVTHGIDRAVKWSQTARGGRQMDLIAATAKPTECSSNYGLCDSV